MGRCTQCGKEIGFSTRWNNYGLCDECVIQRKLNTPAPTEEIEIIEPTEEEIIALRQNLANIFLSTGTIQEPFKVIDVVFAMDSQDQGLFSEVLSKMTGFHIGANPSSAFDKVKLQLRSQCMQLGGDAVINCQFEHRVALANSVIPTGPLSNLGVGKKQTVEIFSYGTVVKLTN